LQPRTLGWRRQHTRTSGRAIAACSHANLADDKPPSRNETRDLTRQRIDWVVANRARYNIRVRRLIDARKIERPKYGYYLDHLVDAVSTAAIAIGIGASPYMMLSLGIGAGLVYMALSINVYLEAQTRGHALSYYTPDRMAMARPMAGLPLTRNILVGGSL
jgi:hypothetical protein